jgi:hypothetical protein
MVTFVKMDSRSLSIFRCTALCVAALLGAQCIWLLLTQLSRSDVTKLPIDAPSAAAAAKQRGEATWAAAIGVIQGNLWAQAGFSYSGLLWEQNGAGANDNAKAIAQAQAILSQAVSDAPCNSGTWLLVAGLAARYPIKHWDTTAALKMSYYTGPSELRLIPFRFLLAVQSERSNDPEIRQFINRDLRFLLSNNQINDVVAAYKVAPPSEKAVIEQTVAQLSPGTLASLRGATPSPGPPD